jgi:hypothetical protein
VELGATAVSVGTGLLAGPITVNNCGDEVPKPVFVTEIVSWPDVVRRLLGRVAVNVSESTKVLWRSVVPARTIDPEKKLPPRIVIVTAFDPPVALGGSIRFRTGIEYDPFRSYSSAAFPFPTARIVPFGSSVVLNDCFPVFISPVTLQTPVAGE